MRGDYLVFWSVALAALLLVLWRLSCQVGRLTAAVAQVLQELREPR